MRSELFAADSPNAELKDIFSRHDLPSRPNKARHLAQEHQPESSISTRFGQPPISFLESAQPAPARLTSRDGEMALAALMKNQVTRMVLLQARGSKRARSWASCPATLAEGK